MTTTHQTKNSVRLGKYLISIDIESLEDNHSCDFIGLKLVDVPLITSYGAF